MKDRWKVTIIFYCGAPEIHRNKTSSEARVFEALAYKNRNIVKVNVKKEPSLEIVKE